MPGRRASLRTVRPRVTSLAVFRQQRGQVGHGADGDQVEQVCFVELGAGGHGLAQRLGQFVGDADTGEHGVGVGGVGAFGVDNGRCRRQLWPQTMVVGDDHIQANAVGVDHFSHRADAAIYSDHQVGGKFFLDFAQGVAVQAIPLVYAVGDVGADLHLGQAEAAQRLGKQDGGGHAVGVEIAIDDDSFISFDGLLQAGDRLVHVGQAKGVGAFQIAVVEEGLHVGRVYDATVIKDLEENGVDVA
jgi:hypothetical protein